MLWGSKYDARVTTGEQARVNREIGEKLGLQVAPLGLVWQRTRQENPDMRLYEAGSDGASALGDYLNAAVLLAILLDKNPMHADYLPQDDQNLPLLLEAKARTLQRHAWETIQTLDDRP